ncbi:MAG: hypothetical protein ACQEVA_14790 [Myxococcota bacterium]
MKRTLFAILVLSMLGTTACKSGPSQQQDPEPTAQSEMDEQASDEPGADETSDERAGPHSEQMQVRLAGEPTVDGPGTLSPSLIADVAEKRQERTVTCFETLEGDLAEPSRQVMLTLRLSRDGAVLEVQSSQQDELGQCVAAEVQRWDFPKPEGGEVESTLEFEYGPSDDESGDGEQDSGEQE